MAGLVSNAGSRPWPASDAGGRQTDIARSSVVVLVIAPTDESRRSFQGDQIRRQVMNVGIPPLREHVDVPLQGIGDHDLWARAVPGEALSATTKAVT